MNRTNESRHAVAASSAIARRPWPFYAKSYEGEVAAPPAPASGAGGAQSQAKERFFAELQGLCLELGDRSGEPGR